MDEISEMSRDELERYARTLETLDEHRMRLEAALPECPSHGRGCDPYALAWIEKAKRLGVTLDDDEIPSLDDEQKQAVADAFAQVGL